MSNVDNTALEAIPLYKSITETLSNYANRDPEWYEISNMMLKRNEKGEFASLFGAYEAYFDKDGFVRNVERVATHGMPTTPKITLEEVVVDYDETDREKLHQTYFSTDENGVVSSDELICSDYSTIFQPGEYVTINFSFTNQQATEKKQLLYALDNFYNELKAISDDDKIEDRQIPIFTLTLVPLLLGGKYSIHASNPFIWQLGDTNDEEKEIYPETLMVAFERENVTFYANDDTSPEFIFKKCRGELASEWLKEIQQRQMELEEQTYKAQREAEIAKLTNRNVKHTFKASKYANEN